MAYRAHLDVGQFLTPQAPAPHVTGSEGLETLTKTNLALKQEDRLNRGQEQDATLAREREAGMGQRQGLQMQHESAMQGSAQGAALASEERKGDQKAMADYYDAVHLGDAVATKMALERLRARGFDADEPNFGPPPAEGATPAQAQPAPMSKTDAQTKTELDSLGGQVDARNAAEAARPAATAGTPVGAGQPQPGLSVKGGGAPSVRRQVAELSLSPGDALLQKTAPNAGPPGMAAPQRAPAPPGQPGASPAEQLIQQTGGAPAPGAFAPPPKPKGLQIRKNGQVISEIDPNQIQAGRVAAITDIFGSLGSEGSDVEKAAGQHAGQLAQSLIGQMPLKDAIEKGMKLYEFEVSQANKTKRSAIGAGKNPDYGGTPGLTKDRAAVLSGLSDDWRQELNTFSTKQDFQAIVRANNAAEKSEQMAVAGNAVMNVGAVAQVVKSYFGAASSNKELEAVMNSGGLLQRIQKKWLEISKTSREESTMPPDFLADIGEMAKRQRSWTTEHFNDIASQFEAYMRDNRVVSGRMTPDDFESQLRASRTWLAGQAQGSGGGGGPVAPKKAGAPGKATPAAPAAPPSAPAASPGSAQRARELLRKRGGM